MASGMSQLLIVHTILTHACLRRQALCANCYVVPIDDFAWPCLLLCVWVCVLCWLWFCR
jgi:hypothetical protein